MTAAVAAHEVEVGLAQAMAIAVPPDSDDEDSLVIVIVIVIVIVTVTGTVTYSSSKCSNSFRLPDPRGHRGRHRRGSELRGRGAGRLAGRRPDGAYYSVLYIIYIFSLSFSMHTYIYILY